MRIYVAGMRSTIKVYMRNVETEKAYLCRVYCEYEHVTGELWIPKSQIEEIKFSYREQEEIMEVSPWYFGKILKGRVYNK